MVMLLRDIINIAKHSELNTLNVKNQDDVILGFINLGLIELYGLFPLFTEEYILPLEDGIYYYDLPCDFMYLVGAFEIRDRDEVVDLPINEEKNPFSVNTINFKQVQIPSAISGYTVGIVYVPRPCTMTLDDMDRSLPLPPNLLQPLLNFVAFKGHSAMTANQEGESNVYYDRFMKSCEMVQRRGLSIASDDLNMDTRIHLRGFV